MDNKISKKICSICGFAIGITDEEIETNCKCLRNTEKCLHPKSIVCLEKECKNYLYTLDKLPDFGKPENFVKLIELKIDSAGHTLWGELQSLNQDTMLDRYRFLEVLLDELANNKQKWVHWIKEEIRTNFKQ